MACNLGKMGIIKQGPTISIGPSTSLHTLIFGCRSNGNYIDKLNRWEGFSSFIVICTIEFPNLYYIAEKNGDNSAFQTKFKDKLISVKKVIVHPGEVNTIKLCPQHLHYAATHSDSQTVFVWDFKKAESSDSNKDVEAEKPLLL